VETSDNSSLETTFESVDESSAEQQQPPKPIISIVGRPNVGKSTLYNRLTRSRDAIVDDRPGVTRDRMVGIGRGASRAYWAVDTGGIESDDEGIHELMRYQVNQALQDSDAVILSSTNLAYLM